MKIRNIVKNFSSLIIAQFLYKLCAFITYIIIARALGAKGFGRLSFVISFVALFNVLLDMGLSELFVRDVAGSCLNVAKRYFRNIISIKCILSISILILITGLCIVSNYLKSLSSIVLFITIVSIFELYTIFFRSVFRTYERMEFEAVCIVIDGFLKLTLFFLISHLFKLTILLTAKILLVSSIVTLLISIYFVKSRFLPLGFSFDFHYWKKLFVQALPFALLLFFGVINFKIDIIMISYLLGDRFTGWYSTGVKLVEPFLIIPVSIAVSFFPVFSKSTRTSPKSLRLLLKKAINISLFTVLPIAIILNAGARHIVAFTFGASFLKSVSILKVLSLALIPFFMKFLLERFILSLRISWIIFISYFAGTLLNIILNLIFGKYFGLQGISFATLISETSIIACNFLYIKNHVHLDKLI